MAEFDFSNLINYIAAVSIETLLVVLFFGKIMTTFVDMFIFDEEYTTGAKIAVALYMILISGLIIAVTLWTLNHLNF